MPSASGELGSGPSEMFGDAAYLPRGGPLAEYLAVWNLPDGPRAAYVAERDRAQRLQTAHRRTVVWSAAAGAAALLVLALQLALPASPQTALLVLETPAVLLAAVLVVRSLFSFRQESWLLHRYRAEQLRSLKFRFAADVRFWTRADDWKQRLEIEVDRILKLSREDLAARSRKEWVPELPAPEQAAAADPHLLAGFVAYYRAVRLKSQVAYFEAKVTEEEESRLDNPRLLPLFFFLGVGLAGVRVLLEWLERGHLAEAGPRMTLAVGLAALAVPTAWTAIRTVRSAGERARNAARSAAKHHALCEYDERLGVLKDPLLVFATLYHCEALFDAEQREWLRLMREAEWYG